MNTTTIKDFASQEFNSLGIGDIFFSDTDEERRLLMKTEFIRHMNSTQKFNSISLQSGIHLFFDPTDMVICVGAAVIEKDTE